MQKKKRRTASLPEQQKRKQKLNRNRKIGMVILAIVFCALVLFKVGESFGLIHREYKEVEDSKILAEKPEIQVELLSINDYSRPGVESNAIRGIVIHYTANPGSTAMQNRDYFEGLKDNHKTKASSHFIVGLDGEIVQCVPTWEIAYASNERNADTVSIECCHPDESGEFTEATYRSMVQLTAWLCEKFRLNADDVIRHYDVTGKICPKYFVENEEAWIQFKEDVRKAMERTEEGTNE